MHQDIKPEHGKCRGAYLLVSARGGMADRIGFLAFARLQNEEERRRNQSMAVPPLLSVARFNAQEAGQDFSFKMKAKGREQRGRICACAKNSLPS